MFNIGDTVKVDLEKMTNNIKSIDENLEIADVVYDELYETLMNKHNTFIIDSKFVSPIEETEYFLEMKGGTVRVYESELIKVESEWLK